MTKVITCVAALRLFEEGSYLMTDPLYEYLPEFKDMNYKQTRDNGMVEILPCTKPIRIVDTFTMSTGYSYDTSDELISAAKAVKNTSLSEFIKVLSNEPLLFEPGTRWHYGFSHDILGALIETISGKSLGDYFNKEIFEPLGMEETFFCVSIPENKADRIASTYMYDEANRKLNKTEPSPLFPVLGEWAFEFASGGLVSSVDDYARFANTLCSGGTSVDGYRLLGNATIDLMRTNHLDNTKMSDYNWDHHSGYGYGLGVRTMVDKATGGSNSNLGEYGWSGAVGTYVLMDPAAELTYVYAQQLMPSKEEYVAPRLRNVVYGCL